MQASNVAGTSFFGSVRHGCPHFKFFLVLQACAGTKAGAVVFGTRIVDDDRVGFDVVKRLTLVFQLAMVRRGGQDLADDFGEVALALDLRKQLLLDDMFFIGVSAGDGFGNFLARRSAL